MNDLEKFNETSLLDKKDIHLYKEDITDADYAH